MSRLVLVLAVGAAGCGTCQFAVPDAPQAWPEGSGNLVATSVLPMVIAWEEDISPDLLSLVDMERDEEIPFELQTLDMGTVDAAWLLPVDPLPQLTDIAVTSQDLPLTAFTTGLSADETPPEATDFDAIQVQEDQTPCDLDLQLFIYLLPSDDTAYHEVQIARGESFAAARQLVTWEDTLVVQSNASERPGVVVPFERGEELWLRTRDVDTSGNAGEWSLPQELWVPRCATSPAGGGLMLALFGLVARRRR